MERGALKGHGALLLANVIWGLNSPICKTVLLSPENPEGLNHFALTVYRLVGAFLLFWLASAFLPRERVAWRDLGGLFIASLFGIQLDQILFLWGLSLTSPINVSIIATTVPILTMILAMFFLREPITPLKTGGVLLGAAGAVLLILISSRGESGGGSIAGDIITLVSSVCYAIHLTACRKVILKYSPVTTMKWMFFFAAIVVVVLYHRPALERGLPGRSRTGLGRSRLRHRTLDVPGLSDGADRPALPASTVISMYITCNPSPRCFSRSCSGSTFSDSRKPPQRAASSWAYGW